MISSFFQSLKQHLATRLARIAVRLARPLPQAGPPPAPPPSGGQAPHLDNLPPFTGTPEEAYLLWNSPPVALFRQKRLIRLKRDGSIPEADEFLKLTALGKVLTREDYIFCDDFGVFGTCARLEAGMPLLQPGRVPGYANLPGLPTRHVP